MSQVKLAVVYYSTYGTNHAMAEAAAKAAEEAGAVTEEVLASLRFQAKRMVEFADKIAA